jgi:hypothetical protein
LNTSGAEVAVLSESGAQTPRAVMESPLQGPCSDNQPRCACRSAAEYHCPPSFPSLPPVQEQSGFAPSGTGVSKRREQRQRRTLLRTRGPDWTRNLCGCIPLCGGPGCSARSAAWHQAWLPSGSRVYIGPAQPTAPTAFAAAPARTVGLAVGAVGCAGDSCTRGSGVSDDDVHVDVDRLAGVQPLVPANRLGHGRPHPSAGSLTLAPKWSVVHTLAPRSALRVERTPSRRETSTRNAPPNSSPQLPQELPP